MQNIYLVGFMAAGKTTVGKELAKRKKMRFADLDKLIESKEKKPISDIFAQNGEPYFRQAEKQALKRISRENKFVVACGGGIVMDEENIKIMKETGIVICLSASSKAIMERSAAFTHRPLLNVKDRKKQIDLLLKLRSSFYARANKTIDTSKIPVKQVVQRALKLLREKNE